MYFKNFTDARPKKSPTQLPYAASARTLDLKSARREAPHAKGCRACPGMLQREKREALTLPERSHMNKDGRPSRALMLRRGQRSRTRTHPRAPALVVVAVAGL